MPVKRITKDPEVRRNELIDAAEHLFLKNGFENTPVSDIVKSLNVAQGTFYYYFKTKDDVLIAILKRKWEGFVREINEGFENRKLNAIQKMQFVLAKFFTPDTGQNMLERYFKGTDSAMAAKFHSQFDELRIKMLKPVMQGIVEEGIRDNAFNELKHADVITEIIFMGISSYMHTNWHLLSNRYEFMDKMEALSELLGKVLGVDQESISFVGRRINGGGVDEKTGN